MAVIDPSGEVVSASSRAPAGLARRFARVPRFARTALRQGYGLSDVQVVGGKAVVETAVAFESPFGRRIQLTAAPVETFVQFLSGTLVRLPRVARGRRLGARPATGAPLGRRRGFSSALRSASAGALRPSLEGSFGRRARAGRFRAGPGARRRDWRVVVVAPRARALLPPSAAASRWVPGRCWRSASPLLVAVALLLRRLSRTAGALQASNAELERSNADLEQFAYVASHDLSEPLRTVAGFSQLLGKRYAGRLDDEADMYIGHMTSGVDRMQQLIDDLLLYSRVGREPVGRDRVELDELLDEVLASIAPMIRDRGARVTSDDLPAVLGERGQLGQVLQNLIANAVKFTAADVTPQVHLSAARRAGMWEIAVRDNGIGVDAGKDHIFKMFGRLHPADAYPGTGIGLALVKRILERHGGDIGVSPAPEGGSIFTFTLPDRAPAQAPEHVEALA
jgi:signal transduction histidine kinase